MASNKKPDQSSRQKGKDISSATAQRNHKLLKKRHSGRASQRQRPLGCRNALQQQQAT